MLDKLICTLKDCGTSNFFFFRGSGFINVYVRLVPECGMDELRLRGRMNGELMFQMVRC